MSSGWEVRFSNSRKLPYFYNASTHTSMWELPEGVSEEQARALPGGHLLGEASQGNQPAQVRASHLLVKHRDSRRPSSWREANITRSKDEAIAQLRAFQDQLGAQPSVQAFAQLAEQFSDCSSARSGGDLGSFGRGQMQRPFEEAAFGLEVGQMSDIVDTDSDPGISRDRLGGHPTTALRSVPPGPSPHLTTTLTPVANDMAAPTVSMPLPTVRKESSATITTGYSAVSFVPTEHVQTAVSEMDDHIVIDIIVPPTRYLPPTLTVAQIMKQIQEDLIRELENLGQGLGSSIASVAHPRSMYAEAEQFMRDAAGRLIDPALLPQNRSEFNRARLGIRSLRGESLLTYFPSPAAAEPKLVNQQVTTCPCVCCRSGCTGADPRTKRLPLLTESLAKDANGNTIVDVPPPQSTARVVLGEPFTEATSLRRDAPRPIPAIRSIDNLRDATAIKYNDIKTHANAAPVLTRPSFPSMPTSQYRREWQIPLPSTGSKPSSHLVVRPNSQRHMDSYDQRAQKGMSVFAPLQLSDDLAAALTLHDLGSTDISPELSRYTPPLSSPSSIGSTPRVRGDTSRPQDLSPPDSSIDATATPIAARYSRSLSNLRHKAQRDAEIPPVPQTPAALLHAPKPPTYAAPSSRVRILSGPTQQSYRFH